MAVGVLMFSSMAMAIEAVTPEDNPAPENSRPRLLDLSISGASAGIRTEYFEHALTDALEASGVFSTIDRSKNSEVIVPMIHGRGIYRSTATSAGAPYFLKIRIIQVDAPSFNTRMTVSMNAVWTFYRTSRKTRLLKKNIYSTYTGGVFEGGLIGANRVRVAMEGAARENIRIGTGMIESLDLEQK